jgi:hypothetical protein
MIEKGLRDLLCADATVGPMVGNQRVRPMMLPEGSDLPAIVYLLIATSPLTSMDGVNALQMKRIQLDCYGKNGAAAKALAKAVHNLLDGYRGFLSEGTEVQSCLPNQDIDLYDSDRKSYCVHCDFNVRFIES